MLGKGPAVMYMNFHGRGTLGGLIPNPKLNRYINDLAERSGIRTQKEVIIGVITDDAFTQHVGTEGVVMSHLSIPLRYTHTPCEVASMNDIDDTTRLLKEIVYDYTKKISFKRGNK